MVRRTRRERETMEYLAAARRFIRRAGERVADADEFELAAVSYTHLTLPTSDLV